MSNPNLNMRLQAIGMCALLVRWVFEIQESVGLITPGKDRGLFGNTTPRGEVYD